MFYGLYGHGAEHPSGSYSHSLTLGSDDDETSARNVEKDNLKDPKSSSSESSSSSSEISSPPQSESLSASTASQYGSMLSLLPEPSSSSNPPNPPSSFHWPIIEEDDFDEQVGRRGEDEEFEGERELELELEEREWEHRGRSRAVPTRLARLVASGSGSEGMSPRKPQQMHNEKVAIAQSTS